MGAGGDYKTITTKQKTLMKTTKQKNYKRMEKPKTTKGQSVPLHRRRCAIISAKVSKAKPSVVVKVWCVAVCGCRPKKTMGFTFNIPTSRP